MKEQLRWRKWTARGIVAMWVIFSGCLFFAALYRKSCNAESEIFTWKEVETNEMSKKIALTFDDGPHPLYTKMLLEGLKERDVKVTFFLTGISVEQNPELVKQMAKEGHLIGNHTYHHVSLKNADNQLIQQEVLATNELIEKVSGQYPQFIRPPFGEYSDCIEAETEMLCVLWNIDPLDWCTEDASLVVKRVLSKAKEDGIILLHDQYKSSVLAAFTIIDELQKEGYQFVTVDELLIDP